MRILVLDGDSNAGRAVVQSLGARGYDLCLAAKDTKHSAFASRYVRTAATYPDPLADAAAFKAWIVAFQEQHHFDLIIPTTECTLVPLHEMRDVEALRDVVAMPSAGAVEGALDKEKLRQLAVSLGVPTPENLLVTRPDELSDPRIDAWLADTAVVVKSVKSKVWDGKGAREFPTRIVTSRAALDALLAPQLALGPAQLQRWIPGRGVGIELLVRHGEIVLSFAHERIHELPLTGGGSSYRKAIPTPPQLLEDSAKLMRALGWHGVAMVEFRSDPASGSYWLMEINGRFWGSLPLAIFAGADFPAALVAMLREGVVPSGPAPRDDVYCRYVARDVAWTKAVLKNRRGGRFLLTRPLGASVLEWGRLLTGKETWDGASLRDPKPLLYELRATVTNEVEAVQRKARRAALLRVAELTSRRKLRALAGKTRLLVLCYGNICRSAYVGERLRSLPELRGVEVRSSGFHRRAGRESPSAFLELAKARGVDLTAHRSRVVDRAEIAWADAVILMDQRNYDLLRELDAKSAAKALWLGAVADDGLGAEVDDPYEEDSATTSAILDRVDRAIDRLANALSPKT